MRVAQLQRDNDGAAIVNSVAHPVDVGCAEKRIDRAHRRVWPFRVQACQWFPLYRGPDLVRYIGGLDTSRKVKLPRLMHRLKAAGVGGVVGGGEVDEIGEWVKVWSSARPWR